MANWRYAQDPQSDGYWRMWDPSLPDDPTTDKWGINPSALGDNARAIYTSLSDAQKAQMATAAGTTDGKLDPGWVNTAFNNPGSTFASGMQVISGIPAAAKAAQDKYNSGDFISKPGGLADKASALAPALWAGGLGAAAFGALGAAADAGGGAPALTDVGNGIAGATQSFTAPTAVAGTSEVAGGSTLSELAATDAEQLVASGVPQAQIASTLAQSYGLNDLAATDIAQLAGQGIPASQIASTAAATYGGAELAGAVAGGAAAVAAAGASSVPPGTSSVAQQALKGGSVANGTDPLTMGESAGGSDVLQNLSKMVTPSSLLQAAQLGVGAAGILGAAQQGNNASAIQQQQQAMATGLYNQYLNTFAPLNATAVGYAQNPGSIPIDQQFVDQSVARQKVADESQIASTQRAIEDRAGAGTPAAAAAIAQARNTAALTEGSTANNAALQSKQLTMGNIQAEQGVGNSTLGQGNSTLNSAGSSATNLAAASGNAASQALYALGRGTTPAAAPATNTTSGVNPVSGNPNGFEGVSNSASGVTPTPNYGGVTPGTPESDALASQFSYADGGGIPDNWRETFRQRAGYTADKVGISTPEQAHQHLLHIEAMRRATGAINTGPALQDYGPRGTTNESIRPTYAQGGAIQTGALQGPGTGTSDSISTHVPEGAYIIPADVVGHLGEAYFDKLVHPAERKMAIGGTVPIRASDGEVVIPPSTVKRLGQKFFDDMRQKYHKFTGGRGNADGGGPHMALPFAVEQAIRAAMPHGRHA